LAAMNMYASRLSSKSFFLPGAYLDTAYELFKMVDVMPDSFIGYPGKDGGDNGLVLQG